jgi:hypothetical protein
MGPFWSIARHLPTLGAGIPCEPLSTGYAPCRNGASRLRFVSCMVHEADRLARDLGNRLPADYPISIGGETLGALTEKRAQLAMAGR